MTDRPHPSDRINSTVAHSARRYDYWLGGKDNFEADRRSADEIEAALPTIRLAAAENRGFLQRATRYLANEGIRQFLDIGTGLPCAPNTHQVAQSVDPAARVVYVDNDPIVLSHARALLKSHPSGRTAFVDADLREPHKILKDPELITTIDLSAPVALFLVAILHFIRDDEEPARLVATLLDALPPGSYVAASHATFEHLPEEVIAKLHKANHDGRFTPRPATEFASFFPGAQLLPPGVQPVSDWWPDEAAQPRPLSADIPLNALIARIP